MDIIDGQLHDIGPSLDWSDADQPLRYKVLTEVMLAWMDATGVRGALLHPIEPDWAKNAIATHPDRFAGVYRTASTEAPNAAELVTETMGWPGAVALRLSFGKLPTDPTGEAGVAKFNAGAFDGFLRACENHGVPLFCSVYGYVHLVADIAKSYPDLSIVVDHMGIAQPPLNPRETPSWKSLPPLLNLGQFDNVAVKMCGVPVLSDVPYPYGDVWPHIHRILEAFGIDRLFWASDIGRFAGRVGWKNKYPEAHAAYLGKHDYAQSLHFLLATDQLSDDEKQKILGGNVQRLLGWPSPRGDVT